MLEASNQDQVQHIIAPITEPSVPEIKMSDMSILDLLSYSISSLASLAMIFGGAVPYLPQYKDIKKTNNPDGFSTKVCLVLTIANILRVLYWFGNHFETPLLCQSFIMIGTMMIMLHLCVTMKENNTQKANNNNSSSDKNLVDRHFLKYPIEYFWQWSRFIDYIQALLFFTLIMAYITSSFIHNTFFVESLGFTAVFVEAMLGMPQFLRNYQNKSTKGMSLAMVLMWLSGDMFKTGYFIMKDAPFQFKLCGCLQVGVDLAILGQVKMYGRGGAAYQKLRNQN